MNEQNGIHTNPRTDTRHDETHHEHIEHRGEESQNSGERDDSGHHRGNPESNLEALGGGANEDWSDIFGRRRADLVTGFPLDAHGDDDGSDEDGPIEPEAVMHRLGTPGNLMNTLGRDRSAWRLSLIHI